MMLLFNIEKMLGPDYEKGLARLKAICENQSQNQSAMEVKEVSWAAHTYLADRSIAPIKELSKVFMDKMLKTAQYLHPNNMVVDGPPSGLYFTWDTAQGTTDLAVAIPVKDASKASGAYSSIRLESSKALVIDYYGPYDRMKPAHDAIHQYAQNKGLKLKSPAIEEYIGDPGVETDPNKVLTKVYYLVEE
jgi:effector-binding domain-containing protein